MRAARDALFRAARFAFFDADATLLLMLMFRYAMAREREARARGAVLLLMMMPRSPLLCHNHSPPPSIIPRSLFADVVCLPRYRQRQELLFY